MSSLYGLLSNNQKSVRRISRLRLSPSPESFGIFSYENRSGFTVLMTTWQGEEAEEGEEEEDKEEEEEEEEEEEAPC
nr:unnamed protein product [Spirometra erinaceieuropaei]